MDNVRCMNVIWKATNQYGRVLWGGSCQDPMEASLGNSPMCLIAQDTEGFWVPRFVNFPSDTNRAALWAYHEDRYPKRLRHASIKAATKAAERWMKKALEESSIIVPPTLEQVIRIYQKQGLILEDSERFPTGIHVLPLAGKPYNIPASWDNRELKAILAVLPKADLPEVLRLRAYKPQYRERGQEAVSVWDTKQLTKIEWLHESAFPSDMLHHTISMEDATKHLRLQQIKERCNPRFIYAELDLVRPGWMVATVRPMETFARKNPLLIGVPSLLHSALLIYVANEMQSQWGIFSPDTVCLWTENGFERGYLPRK